MNASARPHVAQSDATGRPLTSGWRIEVLLAAVVFAVVAPIMQPLAAQQASRLALTAAIVDDWSLRIDGYPLGIDRAEHDGHTYSDKAPGQPIAAVPWYAAYRALGGEPARSSPVEGSWALWVVSVGTVASAGALLVVLMHRIAEVHAPGLGATIALCVMCGTLLLPLSSVLFGHVPAALLALAAWWRAGRAPSSARSAALVGALCGAAILVEYSIALAIAPILVLAAWRGVRFLAWTIAGGVPFAFALAGYQWLAFGSPFEFSYGNSAFASQAEQIGLESLDLSFPENSLRVLLGERGLLTTTPLVALGLVGLVLLARRASGLARVHYLSALGSAVAVILLQCSWSNPTGGDSPGARYATAACAFAVPGVAHLWTRWQRTSVAAAVVGILVMLSATLTNPLEARDSFNAPGIWIDHLIRGQWAHTVYEELTRVPATRFLLLLVPAALLVTAMPHVTPRRGALASGP